MYAPEDVMRHLETYGTGRAEVYRDTWHDASVGQDLSEVLASMAERG
ncbi:hypothetical protein [Streptomyces gobiensis]|nr:hypothetical protein [Streptomyces gobiensis]UGY92894.1 hypothetical protein test1122_15050 [Streptomyces gobiensis]